MEVRIGLSTLVNFNIGFDDSFVECLDVCQFPVLMKPQSYTADRHFTGQFPGSMGAHSVSNDKYVALLGPQLFALGQHDRMSILVVGSPHSDVSDGSVLQAIDPFNGGRIHVIVSIRESARLGYRASPSDMHHVSVFIRDIFILLVSREHE